MTLDQKKGGGNQTQSRQKERNNKGGMANCKMENRKPERK